MAAASALGKTWCDTDRCIDAVDNPSHYDSGCINAVDFAAADERGYPGSNHNVVTWNSNTPGLDGSYDVKHLCICMQ